MPSEQQVRGYLLEEALAWLIRNSGYHLLTRSDEDGTELVQKKNTLYVQGRGAEHQVDVLGAFPFTPAFSLPIRLFVEAKFYDKNACGLSVVRNAHGVISDVNQNFLPGAGRRPRRRYHYSYALFSTTGFSPSAQRFALAHQISLVDLSGHSFAWLRDLIRSTAAQIQRPGGGNEVPANVVNWIRSALRDRLGTPRESPDGLGRTVEEWEPTAPVRGAELPALNQFVTGLQAHANAELLIGFPAAPFILPLHTTNGQSFLTYASRHPAHPVRIHRTDNGSGAEWVITPLQSEQAPYRLTFTLPQHIEDWIAEADMDQEQRRSAAVREQFLSSITIYHVTGSTLSVYQLSYEPAELRRG